MLVTIIKITILIIIVFILIAIMKHNIKNCETFLEKFLVFCFGTIITIPAILYSIDKLDFSTIISNNIDIEFWKSFLETYIGSIVGGILSGGILLFITKLQLDREKEDSQNIAKEERRQENIPYMQYNITPNNHQGLKRTKADKVLTIKYTTIKGNKNLVDTINFSIKNVGMNTAKNCKIRILKIVGEEEANDFTLKLIDNCQGYLLKGEEKNIKLKIKNITPKKIYKYQIAVFYQDLLENKYIQCINLKYKLERKGIFYYHKNTKIEIEKEEMIIDKIADLKNYKAIL